MGEIFLFPDGNIDSMALLESLRDHPFRELVVVGIDAGGNLYVAGTSSEIDKMNMLLDLAKRYFVDCCMTPEVIQP